MSAHANKPVWDEPSEQRVLEAIEAGKTVAQIARAIGVTRNAVSNMLARRRARILAASPVRCVKLTAEDRESQRACLSIFLRVAMGWDHKTAALEVIDGGTPLSMPDRDRHLQSARTRLREVLDNL